MFGILPILYCILHYMNDVVAYMKLDEDIELEDAEEIMVWQVSHQLIHLEKLLNFPFVESSIWPSLVRIRICRLSNPHFLAGIRLEPLQCMESARNSKDSINQTLNSTNSLDNMFHVS